MKNKKQQDMQNRSARSKTSDCGAKASSKAVKDSSQSPAAPKSAK